MSAQIDPSTITRLAYEHVAEIARRYPQRHDDVIAAAASVTAAPLGITVLSPFWLTCQSRDWKALDKLCIEWLDFWRKKNSRDRKREYEAMNGGNPIEANGYIPGPDCDDHDIEERIEAARQSRPFIEQRENTNFARDVRTWNDELRPKERVALSLLIQHYEPAYPRGATHWSDRDVHTALVKRFKGRGLSRPRIAELRAELIRIADRWITIEPEIYADSQGMKREISEQEALEVKEGVSAETTVAAASEAARDGADAADEAQSDQENLGVGTYRTAAAFSGDSANARRRVRKETGRKPPGPRIYSDHSLMTGSEHPTRAEQTAGPGYTEPAVKVPLPRSLVRHAKFGDGYVVRTEGDSNVYVRFADNSHHWLKAEYLEQLPGFAVIEDDTEKKIERKAQRQVLQSVINEQLEQKNIERAMRLAAVLDGRTPEQIESLRQLFAANDMDFDKFVLGEKS